MKNELNSLEDILYQLESETDKETKNKNKKHKLSREDLTLNHLLISAAKHNTEDFDKLKKIKEFKCPVCKKVKYTSTKLLYNHVIKEHSSEIPDNMPVEQYVFNLRNNKTCGKCVICGNPTEWNPKTCKYHRICSEDCKKKYIEETRKRLLRTHGTEDLSKDPEHQKKMLDSRKISKPYKFKDGKEIMTNSSYEYDLLRYIEEVLGYTSTDIQPCAIIFKYQFEGKEHFYIPDFYMPDYNLIIEVKDEGSKASFIARMRQMDIAKYTEVTKSGKYNFITVVGKDYVKLVEVLDYLKNKAYNTDASKKLIIEIDKKNYKNIDVPKKYRLEAANRS